MVSVDVRHHVYLLGRGKTPTYAVSYDISLFFKPFDSLMVHTGLSNLSNNSRMEYLSCALAVCWA